MAMENETEEFRYYSSGAWQTTERCELLPTGRGGNPHKGYPGDLIQIRIRFYKRTRNSEIGEDGYPISISYSLETLVGERFQPMVSREKILSNRSLYAKLYGDELSTRFGVPRSEHSRIIIKIFGAVEQAIRMQRIRVAVIEETVRTRRCRRVAATATNNTSAVGDGEDFDYVDQMMLNKAIRESEEIESRAFRFIPAARSFIQKLKSLKFAAMDTKQQQQQSSCPICLEGFDLHQDHDEAAAAAAAAAATAITVGSASSSSTGGGGGVDLACPACTFFVHIEFLGGCRLVAYAPCVALLAPFSYRLYCWVAAD